MPTVLRVLTQPQVFSHWLKLERQFAVALMDELTSDEFAWTSGEDCVPRCAEGVITLLHAITNRWFAFFFRLFTGYLFIFSGYLFTFNRLFTLRCCMPSPTGYLQSFSVRKILDLNVITLLYAITNRLVRFYKYHFLLFKPLTLLHHKCETYSRNIMVYGMSLSILESDGSLRCCMPSPTG